jgi:hypothetical protein
MITISGDGLYALFAGQYSVWLANLSQESYPTLIAQFASQDIVQNIQFNKIYQDTIEVYATDVAGHNKIIGIINRNNPSIKEFHYFT